MQYDEFVASMEHSNPPEITGSLLALWYDGKERWDKAHEIAQNDDGKEAASVHAYLHRKEGDEWNAGYWYRRAGKDHCKLSLEEEWEGLVKYFLGLK